MVGIARRTDTRPRRPQKRQKIFDGLTVGKRFGPQIPVAVVPVEVFALRGFVPEFHLLSVVHQHRHRSRAAPNRR